MLSRYSRIAPQLLATLEAPGLKHGFGTGVVFISQSVLNLQVTGRRTVPSGVVTASMRFVMGNFLTGQHRTAARFATVPRRSMITTASSAVCDGKAVSEFDVAHRTVLSFLRKWGNAPHQIPASELTAAENAVNKMAEEHLKFANNPDVLGTEVAKLRDDLAALRAAVRKLEKKKTKDWNIMLIRQLAYAIQFSLVRWFPSIFTKREWSVPYSTLRSTVKEIGTAVDKQKLAEIEADFHAVGISWQDIDINLYYLRCLGNDESHRTGTSLSLHNTADVDISTMADAISSAAIDEDLKDFALKALPVLRKYQKPANPLLALK